MNTSYRADARISAQIEPLTATDEMKALLAACALPVSDLSPHANIRFFGIRINGVLAAVTGLELYPPVGMLRSLAVAPPFRGLGLARQLVARAERFAAEQGIESLFLLTTTAEGLFLKLNYSPCARDLAPPAIRGTARFSELCPASSVLMAKRLAPPVRGNSP